MVIRDPTIIDESLAKGALACSRRQVFEIGRLDRLYDAGQRFRHVFRQVTAVGSRIADELGFLVECLSDIESPLRAEPEQTVRRPLQFGEVVQQGRFLPSRFGLD